MRLDYGKRRMPAGFFLFFLACIGIGAVTGPDLGRAERERAMQCAPVQRHIETDEEGWAMLIDQGYTERDGTLVPSGCESVK